MLTSSPSFSTAELTPIPISRPGSDAGSPRIAQSSLRGRVEQQVDALAGSANKVLTGVVDTSFGVLRALLPGQTPESHVDLSTPPGDADQSAAPWNVPQSRFGLLRRDTGFSIASIAASLPGRSKSSQPEESGQQLIDVPSRPGSSRSVRTDEPSEEESDEDDEDEDDEEEGEHDARSIRSFESMMSQRSRQARKRKTTGGRKSLADRLASVPGLARLSQPSDAPKVSLHGPVSRLAEYTHPCCTVGHRCFSFGIASVVSPRPAAGCPAAAGLARVVAAAVAHRHPDIAPKCPLPELHRGRHQGVRSGRALEGVQAARRGRPRDGGLP